MFRLRDGACTLISPDKESDRVAFLDGRELARVPMALRSMLSRVGHGLASDDDAESPEGQALLSLGVADVDLDPDDAHVIAALRDLGARVRWRLDRAHQGEILDVARRIHARRKVFVDAWGQTSCLPESAAARVMRARAMFKEGGRVLLIGDDDFMAVPLALAGFRVTVCDIDPDLVRFAQQMASEHGVSVDARVVDLLRPLPRDLIGAFDGALTDPMSHENCLTVFLGRALAALKPGGRVLSALHPLARRVFHDVARTLPCAVTGYDEQVSAYYVAGFVDVDYVSDLVTLTRTDAALPVAGDAAMPDIDVTVEALPYPAHGYTRILGMKFGAKELTEERLRQALVDERVALRALTTHLFGKHLHVHGTLDDGAAVTAVVDTRRFKAMIHAYPHASETTDRAVRALEVLLQRQGRDHFFPYADQLVAMTPVVEG